MSKDKTQKFQDSVKGNRLRYVHGYFGVALHQLRAHQDVRSTKPYWDWKQFSEKAATIPFGKKETIWTSGSAILVTQFLQGLFATDKWYSVEKLAEIADKHGYACWNKRSRYEDVVGGKWFDQLHEIIGLRSEEVFDAKEVIDTLSKSSELVAYVLQVRNDWFYGVKGLGGCHYMVLMGVQPNGAMVYDSRTGVNTDRTQKQILEATMRAWKVSD